MLRVLEHPELEQVAHKEGAGWLLWLSQGRCAEAWIMVGDVLGGKLGFPLLPAFTTHLPPGNLMSQARALLIHSSFLELMRLLGNLGVEPMKELKAWVQ